MGGGRFRIEGYIISNDRSKEEFSYLDIPVYHLKDILECKEEYTIIVAAYDNEIRENLNKHSLDYIDPPNWIYPFIKDYVEVLL